MTQRPMQTKSFAGMSGRAVIAALAAVAAAAALPLVLTITRSDWRPRS